MTNAEIRAVLGIGPPAPKIRPFEGIKLDRLVQTCDACPSQWEGEVNGHAIYIRLRHGAFRVDIDGQSVFHDSPRGYDGAMSTDEMLQLTGFVW